MNRKSEGAALGPKRLARCACLAVCFVAVGAAAQEPDTDLPVNRLADDEARHAESEERNDSSARLEEVVVTANKREEIAAEVPASVSVMTGRQLEEIRATNFQDFAAYMPGVSSSNRGTGMNQVIVRGVTPGPGTLSATTGVYVDETPVGSSTAFAIGSAALDFNTFDLERLEMLAGPQGTLYGASTLGGLLKYVTRDPEPGLREQLVDAEVSSTHDGGMNHALRGALAMPLWRDAVALRATAFTVRDAGVIDNARRGIENVNDADAYGGRAKLLAQLTPELNLRLSAMAQRIDRGALSHVDRDPRTGKPPEGQGELEDSSYVPEPFYSDFQLYAAVLDWDSDYGALTFATSWQEIETLLSIDVTRFIGGLLGTGDLFLFPSSGWAHTRKWTQELRFAVSAGDWEWLLGGYFTYEDSLSTTDLRGETNPAYAPLPVDPLRPVLATAPLFHGEVPTIYREIAAFGNLTYSFTPQFDVTLGLRQARNDQDYVQRFRGIFANPQNPTQTSEGRLSSSENVTTYLLSPRLRVTDDVLLYGRIASGYRPGGPNFVTRDASGQPNAPPTFDADTLWNYEVGAKASVPSGRASLEASVYQLDWDDMQIVVNRNGVNNLENAGAARIRGAELRLSGLFFDWLTLHGAAAYNDARLVEDSPQIEAKAGQRLPLSPRFSGSLIAEARFPLPIAADAAITAGTTYRYVGERTAGYDGSSLKPQYRVPAYEGVDIHAAVTAGALSGRLSLRNVFDEIGQVSADPHNLQHNEDGPVRASIVQPRTVILSLVARFY